jgi:tRNA pseudouridine13 synthase
MSNLSTKHWSYLYSQPTGSGVLKAQPDDFKVSEILGYEPNGDGEHIYLWTRKVGLNTAYVAEQLAKFCQLPLRNVSYAGRKDKHAVSEQWFGLHVPGKRSYDWSEMALEGFEVLHAKRHNKKLRTGVLKGNAFAIRIRQITQREEVLTRLEKIKQSGVPNYYGEQRFGLIRATDSTASKLGGNLLLAEKMLQGETIRNRNKRSMAISAMRSWLFNEFVSQRVSSDTLRKPINGDVFVLNGSNSYFTEPEINHQIVARLASGDIQISAPLWGSGPLSSQTETAGFEQAIAKKHADICNMLEQLGLKQERRFIHLNPQGFNWEFDQNDLLLNFSLPSGCFATSVIRELTNISQQD